MTLKMHSSKNEKENSSEETRVIVFVHQMLMLKTFVATYIGRYYVNKLIDFRDVLKIYVEEKEDFNLVEDLKAVKKRIDVFYRGAVWSAITGPDDITVPNNYSLWVSHMENVPLGTYMFSIENVEFSKEEVIIKVKVLRKFEAPQKSYKEKFEDINWSKMKSSTFEFFQETVTWYNIKEFSKFMFLLLMTLGTGLMFALKYLGEYSLHFFREFNNFIKVATPIFVAIIDLVSKVIGGLFILIALLFGRTSPPPNSIPQLMAPSPRRKAMF